MKNIALLLVCLAILPVQADELFRWVDKDGKVHYGDMPPTDAAKLERKKLSSEAAQNEDLPFETRRAQQNFPVTLYVGEVCAEPCTLARSLLNRRGVPFSEKLLKTKKEIEAFQKLSGGLDSPTLQVGRTYLRGYIESDWNSELDVAGYPRTATYRQRLAPAKSSTSETPPAENNTTPSQPQ